MKKIAMFFAIVIFIVCGIFYFFLNYKVNYNTSRKANLQFEKYLNEEVQGTDLATVINRAIDSNLKNNVEKNNKGIFQNNNKDSISIEIKITDNDSIYQMETLYNSNLENFMKYYGKIKFKCVDIKYHETTNKVKYLLFEQVSE